MQKGTACAKSSSSGTNLRPAPTAWSKASTGTAGRSFYILPVSLNFKTQSNSSNIAAQ